MSAPPKILLDALGYRFRQEGLLLEALTHRSAGSPNNERFEFLGDALLNWLVAEVLYRLKPAATEGDLSRLRASLVCEAALAGIASRIGLGDYLQLGPGELRSGGHGRKSIQADALEALVAAVYLDGGIDAARALVMRLYHDHFAQLPDAESLKDSKTRLQEFLQERALELPRYELIETRGKAHAQRFHVRGSAAGMQADGEGDSRRAAEQDVAARLLAELRGR